MSLFGRYRLLRRSFTDVLYHPLPNVLVGDADTNLLLSPFKVRFPRSLTPKIKIEDAVWLTLRRLEPKESERAELVNGGQTGNRGGSWVPIDSG